MFRFVPKSEAVPVAVIPDNVADSAVRVFCIDKKLAGKVVEFCVVVPVMVALVNEEVPPTQHAIDLPAGHCQIPAGTNVDTEVLVGYIVPTE